MTGEKIASQDPEWRPAPSEKSVEQTNLFDVKDEVENESVMKTPSFMRRWSGKKSLEAIEGLPSKLSLFDMVS